MSAQENKQMTTVLGNEFDRLNQKMDIVLNKLGGLVDLDEVEPKWPPLVLMNASAHEVDNGVTLKLWYQTQGQCADIIVNWWSQYPNARDMTRLGLGESNCLCFSTRCVGFTSFHVQDREQDRNITLIVKDMINSFFYTVNFRVKSSELKKHDMKDIRDQLFYVTSPREVIYKQGDDAVFHVLYSKTDRRSVSNAFGIQFLTLPDLDLQNRKISIDKTDYYSDVHGDVAVLDKVDYLHYSKFKLHIKASDIKPVGLATFSLHSRSFKDGPIRDFVVKQEIPIHEINQKGAYPKGYLNWTATTLPCEKTSVNESCILRCEAIGNNVHDLLLRKSESNREYHKVMPKYTINWGNFHVMGVWEVAQPETLETIDFECLVLHENNNTAIQNSSIPLYIPPKILTNESMIDFNKDNLTLSAVCVANGYPVTALTVIIKGYCDSIYWKSISEEIPVLDIDDVNSGQVVGRIEDRAIGLSDAVCNFTFIISCRVSILNGFLSDNAEIGTFEFSPMYFYIPAKILTNESMIDFNEDNSSLNAVCVANGYPIAFMTVEIRAQCLTHRRTIYTDCYDNNKRNFFILRPYLNVTRVNSEQIVGRIEDIYWFIGEWKYSTRRWWEQFDRSFNVICRVTTYDGFSSDAQIGTFNVSRKGTNYYDYDYH